MIEKTLIKYMVAGGVAFGVDVFAFTAFRFFALSLAIANPMARLIGALTAFIINRQWTFKRISPRTRRREFGRYALLWCFSTLCSTFALAVLIYAFPGVGDVYFKVLVECVIVAMNYVVSRVWVFSPGKDCGEEPPKDSLGYK